MFPLGPLRVSSGDTSDIPNMDRSRSPRRPRPTRWLGLLALAALLAGCSVPRAGEAPATVVRPTEAPGVATSAAGDVGVLGLVVEPDDGREPILDELSAAARTIDVMVYLLTDRPIINALVAAEDRGVQVRVILEQQPFGGSGNPEETASTLRRAGAEVRWSSSAFTFTHAKTILVDRSLALILSLNLTRSAFESNREFGIVTDRPALVEPAQRIFDADWNGRPVNDAGGLVVSPIGSREAMAGLIRSAVRSIDIYAEVIRDDAMVRLIASKASDGVAVRLVMSPDEDPAWVPDRAALLAAGVELRYMGSPYVHAKAILVDGARLFVGSENFTQTSLDENREIGVITDDPTATARVAAAFERDFDSGDAAVTVGATPTRSSRIGWWTPGEDLGEVPTRKPTVRSPR